MGFNPAVCGLSMDKKAPDIANITKEFPGLENRGTFFWAKKLKVGGIRGSKCAIRLLFS